MAAKKDTIAKVVKEAKAAKAAEAVNLGKALQTPKEMLIGLVKAAILLLLKIPEGT